MNRFRSTRCQGDDGAVLVEAAFAFPIFLYLMMGFVDLSLAVFSSVQASSSARDVARYAILYPTASNTAYRAQAVEHLEATPKNLAVSVTCDPTCSPGGSVTATVTWSRNALTFAGSFVPTTVRSTATMTILGVGASAGAPTTSMTVPPTTTTTVPTTTTSSAGGVTSSTAATTTTTTSTLPTTTTTVVGQCAVNTLTVTQPLNRSSAQNKLDRSMEVKFQTNGAVGCTSLKVKFWVDPTDNDTATTVSASGSAPNHSITVGKNAYTGWTAGAHTVQVLVGTKVIYTSTFTIT